MSYLIKDTTKEERQRIVEESLGNISGSCDGCMPGLAEMYQDYIDGKREIAEINMSFNAHYERDMDMSERSGCEICRSKGHASVSDPFVNSSGDIFAMS